MLASSKSSLTLALIAVASPLLMGEAGCQTPNPSAPGLSFRAKLYVTDSKSASILRKDQAAPGGVDVIPATSSRFDDRVCITIDEYKRHLQDLVDLSYQCKDWGTR